MTITTTTPVTKITLQCECGRGTLSAAIPFNGDTRVEIIWSPFDPTNASVIELIRRVKAGIIDREWYDTDSKMVIPYDDLPSHLWHMEALHPFHADERHLALGALVHHGNYSEDSDTGHPRVAFNGALEPGDVTPTGATYNQSLGDWNIVTLSANEFRLFIDIDEGANVMLGQADNYPPAIGILHYLDDIRTAGSLAVATLGASDDFGAALGASRVFRIPQTDTENVDVTLIASGVIYNDANTKVTSLSADFRQQNTSPAAHNAAVLATLLSNTNQPIPSQEGAIKAGFGSVNRPLYGNKWVGPDAEKEWINGRLVAKGTLFGQRYSSYESSSRGLIVPYAKLPASPSPRRYPAHPAVREVHFEASETAPGIIQLPTPRELLKYGANVMYGSLHNRNASQPVTINDFNGAPVLALEFDENLEFKVSFDSDGQGELLGVSVPERLQVARTGELGNMGDVGYFNYDASFWARIVVCPTDDADFVNLAADVFTLGTATSVNGSAWNAANAPAIRQSLTVDKAGELHFIQTIDVELVGDGTVAGNHFIQLFRKRGDTMEDWGVPIQHDQLTGNNSTRTYRWENLGTVQAGDIIFPMYMYAKSSSANPANLNVTNFHRSARLKPRINTIFTP